MNIDQVPQDHTKRSTIFMACMQLIERSRDSFESVINDSDVDKKLVRDGYPAISEDVFNEFFKYANKNDVEITPRNFAEYIIITRRKQ